MQKARVGETPRPLLLSAVRPQKLDIARGMADFAWSTDDADRARFLAGPKSLRERQRDPLPAARVKRAPERPPIAATKGHTWPSSRSRSSRRYRRRQERTDIHSFLEQMVIASYQTAWSSDEESDTDGACDGRAEGTAGGHDAGGRSLGRSGKGKGKARSAGWCV